MITLEIDYSNSRYIVGGEEKELPFGTFLIDFFEMDICTFFDELSVCEEKGISPLNNEYYHAEIPLEHRKYLENKFPKYITRVLLYNSIEQINFMGKSKSKSSIQEMKEKLKQEYFLIRNELIKVLFESCGSDWFDLYEVRAFFGLKRDGSGTPYALYGIDNINSLISVELFCLQCSNIHIKVCENCGKYFLPSKRSDEIYCDRIYKNDKTCKDVGYIEKEKKNPIKSLYTTARKTQHARIRYNSHIPDYKEKHFEPWKKAAEEARDRFQKTNDVEGFKKWLEDNKDAF